MSKIVKLCERVGTVSGLSTVLKGKIVAFGNRLRGDTNGMGCEKSLAEQLIEHMNVYVSSINGANLRLMKDGSEGVYLHTLQVPPAFRRKRLGTDVMSELIRKADELDVHVVLNSSPVDADNAPDHAALTDFYKQFGFEEAWDYASDITAAFDGPKDGTWTRMLRRPNRQLLGVKP